MNTAKEIEVSVRRFEQAGVTVKGSILNGVVKKLVATMVMDIIITDTRIQIKMINKL